MGCDRCDRCLQDACFPLCSLSLHASFCQLARSRSLSFPLITLLLSLFFFSGDFSQSFFLAFFDFYTLTLYLSLRLVTFARRAGADATPNHKSAHFWSLTFPNLKNSERVREQREARATRSGGQRRRAKSFRAFKITRRLWHKAVSGLSSDWLKPH